MLCLSRPDEHLAALFREDIFRVLGDISPSISKAFRSLVKDSISKGKAVSVDLELSTKDGRESTPRGISKTPNVEHYVTHWTPIKDQNGKTKFIVLIISPR